MSPPIYTPDGTEVSEIVLPDGSTASQVIGPDGNVVFEARADIPDSGVARWAYEQDLTDSWGSRDGTNNGGTFSTDAEVGTYAYDLDGTDDYGDFGDVDAFSDFTITGWFKTSGISDDLGVFHTRQNGTTANERTWWIVMDGGFGLASAGAGGIVARSGDGQNNGSDTVSIESQNTYDDGQYHHLAFAVSATDDIAELYIDGSEVDSQSGIGGAPYTGTATVYASREVGESRFWTELQDDIRYYSKRLSSTEVSDLYNTGSI